MSSLVARISGFMGPLTTHESAQVIDYSYSRFLAQTNKGSSIGHPGPKNGKIRDPCCHDLLDFLLILHISCPPLNLLCIHK